ncbi:MAG: hypothetical protein R2752_03395 [Vicinamibacterales bacterium]
MRVPRIRAAVLLLSGLAASCGGSLGRQYEYEEQVYLSVDGAATIVVDASLPALVALRGLPLDLTPGVRPDRDAVRAMLEARGCAVSSVGQPWTRRGRRFIQVRVATEDIRTVSRCGLLDWSTYGFEPAGEDELQYDQRVGAAAGGDPGAVNWDGSELVGFKLHLPSKILEHNVKRLEDGENGSVERGNILTYEQRFADRRAGVPVEMKVRMGADSILARTLIIFGIAFAAAVLVLGGIIWVTIRRARR